MVRAPDASAVREEQEPQVRERSSHGSAVPRKLCIVWDTVDTDVRASSSCPPLTVRRSTALRLRRPPRSLQGVLLKVVQPTMMWNIERPRSRWCFPMTMKSVHNRTATTAVAAHRRRLLLFVLRVEYCKITVSDYDIRGEQLTCIHLTIIRRRFPICKRASDRLGFDRSWTWLARAEEVRRDRAHRGIQISVTFVPWCVWSWKLKR